VYRLRSKYRPWLTASCTLLIVAALQHCSWEAGLAIQHAQDVAALAQSGKPLPVGTPVSGCDNESGCICRGATQAHGADLTALAPIQIDQWHQDGNASPPLVVSDTAKQIKISGDTCPLPPVSGRILRALLSSLLI
jgi:hypothetical protein